MWGVHYQLLQYFIIEPFSFSQGFQNIFYIFDLMPVRCALRALNIDCKLFIVDIILFQS